MYEPPHVGCYDENTHEGSFGLLLPDFTPKPSYYAYKDWVTAASRHCFPAFLSLSSPAFLPNGTARLQVSADPQFTYTVQVSGNLTQWTNLATNVGSANNTFDFDDPGAAANSNRFYRLRW